MFSGVRSTNFTNTLLNLVYYELAKEYVADEYGLHPIDEYHLHQGDDVWISNKSRLWAATLYNVMQSMGFIFLAGKQMFDINRGEFLRSILELAPQSKASALNSQIHLLHRRGFLQSGTEILWWALIKRALQLRLPERAVVSIPTAIAQRGFRDGGLDLGASGTYAVRSIPVRPLPAPIAFTKVLESAIPTNMTDDWLDVCRIILAPFIRKIDFGGDWNAVGYDRLTNIDERTGRLPNGELIGVDKVASLAYYELATGRAANLTDWEEEKRKRVGPRLPLTYPGTKTEITPHIKATAKKGFKGYDT
ncbi:unnamed protein product [Lepeophtheirus salmonis]|uniref:(salmon louse) hypothetical protein n=1 Tax=Lepeophtheirus salmonis TaxID=72036 RepID=A0A7R8CUC5_LEPSM|nr:unnamed protein product [Lepeophtheirus salmonis]CAF2935367.1 unnamed protein product [Lepeophtheirus salmonis]